MKKEKKNSGFVLTAITVAAVVLLIEPNILWAVMGFTGAYYFFRKK